MKNEFKVGDRVRIREWNDMKKEFGLNGFDSIKCEFSFTSLMTFLCGRTATITYINDKRVHLKFDDESGITFWDYSTDMIEPLLPKEKITVKRNNNKEELLMQKEFKIGDRVKIRRWDDMEKEFGCNDCGEIACNKMFVRAMKYLCGCVATITDFKYGGVKLKFDDISNGNKWEFSTDMIEPLFPNEKITIERYNNKVVAKWGKRTGVAKCSPEDKFDFFIGATLAFERLMQSENVTRKIIDDALDRVRDELYETHGIKKIG